MPSPFPGIDPYLESPEIFPDFHDSFITYLRETLQASLPAPYFAALPECSGAGAGTPIRGTRGRRTGARGRAQTTGVTTWKLCVAQETTSEP